MTMYRRIIAEGVAKKRGSFSYSHIATLHTEYSCIISPYIDIKFKRFMIEYIKIQ